MIGNLLKCLVIDIAVQTGRELHQTDWSFWAVIGSLIPSRFLHMHVAENVRLRRNPSKCTARIR